LILSKLLMTYVRKSLPMKFRMAC